MRPNYKSLLSDILLAALAPIALIVILSDYIRLDIKRPLARWIFKERLTFRDANYAAWQVLNQRSEIVRAVRVNIARLRLMGFIVAVKVGRDGKNEAQETDQEEEERTMGGCSGEGDNGLL